jgi:hypothetical protein
MGRSVLVTQRGDGRTAGFVLPGLDGQG